jgi:hypothetical protein
MQRDAALFNAPHQLAPEMQNEANVNMGGFAEAASRMQRFAAQCSSVSHQPEDAKRSHRSVDVHDMEREIGSTKI